MLFTWHGPDSGSAGAPYVRSVRSLNNGLTWDAPSRIAAGNSPSACADINGKLYIAYELSGMIQMVSTSDRGYTWGSPVSINPGTDAQMLARTQLNTDSPIIVRRTSTSILLQGSWKDTAISGTDGYLGTMFTLNIPYTITDSDTSSRSVTETLNGVALTTRPLATIGQQYLVNGGSIWNDLTPGSTIPVSIACNGITRNYTVTKGYDPKANISTLLANINSLAGVNIRSELASKLSARGIEVLVGDSSTDLLNKLPLSSIKSVQRGTAVMSNGSATFTATISTVDMSKAVVVVNGVFMNGAIDVRLDYVRAELTSPNTVILTKGTTSSAGPTVSWAVIEFANVKSIQRGVVGTFPGTVTIAPVNTSKSMVFFSFSDTSSTGTYGNSDFFTLDLSSSTTIDINGYGGGTTSTIAWQVVEFI